MKSRPVIYLLSTILSLIFLSLAIYAMGFELDACGYIDKVVDGDTIWMTFTELNRSKFPDLDLKSYKIRFADINAPEIDTDAGIRSRDELIKIIGKLGSRICIDIDDDYIHDPYGRIVAVIYIPVNETHYLNLNMYMVENGYAVIKNYRNEFDPYGWSLYVESGGGTSIERGEYTYIALIILILIVLIIMYRRRGFFT